MGNHWNGNDWKKSGGHSRTFRLPRHLLLHNRKKDVYKRQLFFYFVAVMQAFPFGQSLLAMIQQSEFLTALYEDNMVAYVVQYVL